MHEHNASIPYPWLNRRSTVVIGRRSQRSLRTGFNALRVFGWLDEIEPSWYTAVPTMHQAILSRASRNADSVERARNNLRLVRSSSSSLPPQVMKELEDTFDVPVVEAYGMTEAAHQMACNPLPPAVRKPGSVGSLQARSRDHG